MVDLPNFYENLKEAEMRLRGTVVLYDNDPYYVLCVANHKDDGKLRIYLDPIRNGARPRLDSEHLAEIPYNWTDDLDDKTRGEAMDLWIKKNPTTGIIRKFMDSSYFNKFRPFPLGMLNFQGTAYYAERSPVRRSEQGLTASMVTVTPMRASPTVKQLSLKSMLEAWSAPMYDCIKGIYPTAEQALLEILDDSMEGESIGFHRDFAFIRGPMESVFLGYKTDVIGHVLNDDLSGVKLSKKFKYTREAVEGLKLFSSIK